MLLSVFSLRMPKPVFGVSQTGCLSSFLFLSATDIFMWVCVFSCSLSSPVLLFLGENSSLAYWENLSEEFPPWITEFGTVLKYGSSCTDASHLLRGTSAPYGSLFFLLNKLRTAIYFTREPSLQHALLNRNNLRLVGKEGLAELLALPCLSCNSDMSRWEAEGQKGLILILSRDSSILQS